jgi:hypothetical protein
VALGAVLATSAVAFFQRAFATQVADLDSFYHLGHAAAYAGGSLFDTSFPWARYSVVGAWGADLWWGFHVLLVPFAALWDLPGSIAVAGTVLTTALVAAVLLLGVRHRWVWPWMWPLLFLLAVPNVLYRHLMVRPHVLSLLALLLLLSALTRERWRAAGLATALLVWIHASLFWMPVVVLLAYAAAELLDRRFEATGGTARARLLQPSLAVGGGIVAGMLLRPHPVATLRLVDVQIFRVLREQSHGLPLSFGGELIPLPPAALGPSSWVLLLPWAVALVILVWSVAVRAGRLAELPRGDRLLMVTSGALSVLFLAVTLTVASRALVEWAAFATILVAMIWSRLPRTRAVRGWATGMTGLVTLLALPWIAGWLAMNVRLNALPNTHLRQAAIWMEERSDEGDVVFHAHWDNFAPLFGWNRTNHYVGGMDPIFQYAHDRELYWKHAHLARGTMAATTCGAYPCPPGSEVDTHTVLTDDFGARWVLVEPRRNPALFAYLTRDPRFDLSLRTRGEAVFEVLP